MMMGRKKPKAKEALFYQRNKDVVKVVVVVIAKKRSFFKGFRRLWRFIKRRLFVESSSFKAFFASNTIEETKSERV